MGPVRRYVNNIEVREGAVIPGTLISTHTFFGRRVETAALCLGTNPDRWRALIRADGVVVWEGGEHGTESAAMEEGMTHARKSVDRALRGLFR